MTAHQVALAAGIFFWSLIGIVPIYFGIRVWQNKMRELPIKGYRPHEARDLPGLNKWVSSYLLLMGFVLIAGGVLAGTISLLFIVPVVAVVSLCATLLEKGAARFY
jgi:hypothetical protein